MYLCYIKSSKSTNSNNIEIKHEIDGNSVFYSFFLLTIDDS